MSRYSRRGVHGQAVDMLGRRIVQGQLGPGTVIDPEDVERELSVSRTVVREAIKVLAAKGLVDALPRRGTYVLPRSQWNLLDADVMTWRETGRQDAQLLRDLEEVRQIVEPAGARFAAERRRSEDIDEIEAALTAMEDEDVDRRSSADIRFHRALLAATHNELLERLEVVLEPLLRARDMLAFSTTTGGEFIDLHAAVLDAVRTGDPDTAQKAMQTLLHHAAADSLAASRRAGRKRRRRSAAP